MFKLDRTLYRIVCAVALLSVLLAACGPTAAPAEPVAPTEAPPPTQAPTEAPPPTAVPAPTEAPPPTEPPPTPAVETGPKGELVAVRQDEPPTLDWKDITNEPQTWVAWAVMEGLTDLDSRTKEVRPVLAESWEWDGANTWTFKLRQGITFHNGEPFNAEAVVYSWQRVADPEENSQLAQHTQNLEYVKALDEYTVEFKHKTPDPIFDARVRVVRIAAPKYSQEHLDLLSTTLIGTGPYKFVEWVKGQHLKLTANMDYWGDLPAIKDITIVFRAEPSVRAAMVQAGEAQLAWTINPDDIPNVPKAVQYTDLRTIAMQVDCTGQNPALADVRVRQAMLYAVDAKTVMETLFKDVALQVKGNQQVPPATLGYDPNMEYWPFDPEKAKALLAEAEADGVPIDTPISIVERGVGWFPRDNEFAEYVANVWNELGLNVTVDVLESAAWADVLFAIKPEDDHGDLMYMLHSVELMDYSHSADRFLYCGARISLWCDETTDEMLTAAAQLGGEERAKAFQDVAHYLEDKVPFFAWGTMLQTHATATNLVWDPRPDGLGNFWEMSFAEE